MLAVKDSVFAGAVDPHRLAQQVDQPSGERVERRVRPFGLHEHHELVAAEAPDRVLLAHRLLEPLADDAQEQVPGRVPEVVVHVLEAVHVDEQRAGNDLRLTPGAREHLLGPIQDQRTVREPGERVVEGLVRELARLLPHERARPGAAGAEHEHEQAQQQAEEAFRRRAARSRARPRARPRPAPHRRSGPSSRCGDLSRSSAPCAGPARCGTRRASRRCGS